MNIAALLALLLSSGVCAKNEFHAQDGATLRVVVCPMLLAPADTAPDAPPPAPPPRPEVQAML